jgi:hypothetical protein
MYSDGEMKWVRKKKARRIPPSVARDTHKSAMNTSLEIDRSPYTQPFIPPSPEECQRGREIAAQQLIEMQKDPEEWASFLHECELFATGYFTLDE